MIYHGDLFDVLPTLADESIDSCVTDPPYGIGVMGKKWDTFITGQHDFQAWTKRWAREVYRVLKPGAHLLVCGAPRSFHRMTSGVEDAGFEIRDCLSWLYGQGFPKSYNLSRGRGTALKPSWEPIVLARKPLVDALDVNAHIFGTGALNIDACRTPHDEGTNLTRIQNSKTEPDGDTITLNIPGHSQPIYDEIGRWPPNVLLDETSAALLDEQTGALKASRFMYVAKPSGKERDEGCYDLAPRTSISLTGRKEGSAGSKHARAGTDRKATNFHPTVKPLELMRWLVVLVTPPGGTILDPFLGSGTTGMASRLADFKFIGVEREAEYVEIARRRISETNALFSGEEEVIS